MYVTLVVCHCLCHSRCVSLALCITVCVTLVVSLSWYFPLMYLALAVSPCCITLAVSLPLFQFYMVRVVDRCWCNLGLKRIGWSRDNWKTIKQELLPSKTPQMIEYRWKQMTSPAAHDNALQRHKVVVNTEPLNEAEKVQQQPQ